MKFRFTIGRKILLGFGILIFMVAVAFTLTLFTLTRSREINDKIARIYTPSIIALQEMKLLITNSQLLITNWINVPGASSDKGANSLNDCNRYEPDRRGWWVRRRL